MKLFFSAAACTVLVLANAVCTATPIKIVTTGDSHTKNYTRSNRFQNALDEIAPGTYVSESVHIPGNDAPEFAGILENPLGPGGLIDHPAAVLALNPDVIVFMLGTNDATHDARGKDYFNDWFTGLVPGFIERFTASGARVIVMSPPPVLPVTDVRAATEAALVSNYDPFIASLVPNGGPPLLSLRNAITSLPDWQSLYGPDGIHFLPAGYIAMAEIVAEAVADATIPGDTNGDGLIDIVDLNNVRNNFGSDLGGDTNYDGVVDVLDLNSVRNRFGAVTTTIPEPSSSGTLMLGILLLYSVQRTVSFVDKMDRGDCR